MAIIVDTSVIIAVILNEASKEELIKLTAGFELLAPLSLHWEIGNALTAMFKRRRLTLEEGQKALTAYQKIPLRFLDVSLSDSLSVAEAHKLYAYDAYFIVCARMQGAPLLTLDMGLQNAARAAGISIIEVTT